jgi:hypothetical protein
MTEQTWRLEPIGEGHLAWLYLRPHRVTWDVPSSAAADAGYTITGERQSLRDDQLGACIRYLAVRQT